MKHSSSLASLFTFLLLCSQATAAPALEQAAADALRRAVDFFHLQVASHGGYVYRYSANLAKREGEGKTSPDTVWVEPPGTPAVGMAYVDAYESVGEDYLLRAARDAAECLIKGQLRSGGWESSIEFAPSLRPRHAYRIDPLRDQARNWTTFDDDKSQSAMRMLMQLDKVLEFQDARVHEAIRYALDATIKSQYPNGAWPQRFRESPDPTRHPVKQAAYPDAWSRLFPNEDYKLFYTFNDNTIADVIDTLLLAAKIYNEPAFRQAAIRGGEFMLLAQMPDPQPAWAQQYDFQMHPVWARKFEPPAISGGESQGVMESLLNLYVETEDRKFLAALPRAFDYLRGSQISEGQLARFYELRTNRPLYFTKKYELTYDDGDVPTHYGFKVGNRLDRLQHRYQQIESLTAKELAELRSQEETASTEIRVTSGLEAQVRTVISALDKRGAWVEEGTLRYHGEDDDTRRVITSSTFARNIGLLSRYLAAVRSANNHAISRRTSP